MTFSFCSPKPNLLLSGPHSSPIRHPRLLLSLNFYKITFCKVDTCTDYQNTVKHVSSIAAPRSPFSVSETTSHLFLIFFHSYLCWCVCIRHRNGNVLYLLCSSTSCCFQSLSLEDHSLSVYFLFWWLHSFLWYRISTLVVGVPVRLKESW